MKSIDSTKELTFEYAGKKFNVNRLIAQMADMDAVARKRAELRGLVEAAVEPKLNVEHTPSDNTQIAGESDEMQ